MRLPDAGEPRPGRAEVADVGARRTGMSGFLNHARSPAVVATAVRVALVVGTVLTLINQGDALFGPGRVSLLKAALTYAIPYLVSTHGAVTARMRDGAAPDL
jgi:hypothetical protein